MTLSRFAEQVGDLLTDSGFTRRGARFQRVDYLVRTVSFDRQKYAHRGEYAFDILFELGMPGLSWNGTVGSPDWVVRAHASELDYQRTRPGHRVEFVLRDGEATNELREAVRGLLTDACREFLLYFEDGNELYEFVRAAALDKIDPKGSAGTRFDALNLGPGSPVARLELAAQYALHLGRLGEARDLLDKAIATAERQGVDYVLDDFKLGALPSVSRTSGAGMSGAGSRERGPDGRVRSLPLCEWWMAGDRDGR